MPRLRMQKPKVIGLYGLPGSGKSTLLHQLRRELDPHDFVLHEGSERIAETCPGGITAFGGLSQEEKKTCREQAIRSIRQDCIDHGRCAVVTGHFMFCSDSTDERHYEVWTSADADTFTHIIYLDVPTKIVEYQRATDPSRFDRESVRFGDIEAWKQAEKDGLRTVCYDHSILLSFVRDHGPRILTRVLQLLRDFRLHDEDYNRENLIAKLDEIISTHCSTAETILMLDADKTIAPFDSGDLFWTASSPEAVYPLKRLFSSFGRSYRGFRQLMLEYEGFGEDELFHQRCAEVAGKINIYPEFLRLLRLKAHDQNFCTIITTCGLDRVWSLVLERENLSRTVHIIGSGRLECKYVVTAEGKRNLVDHLQGVHNLRVWAFGDSPLDLPMLQQADEAIVVVAAEPIRSQSMDGLLKSAITANGFRARQVLLPGDADISPRLTSADLPVVNFADLVAQEIHPTTRGRLELIQCTDTTKSKLLATGMRDARISGHGLREVHIAAGFCLAMDYVSEIIGLEQFSIPHVSGGDTTGFRLRHEGRTTVVACMRGGEAMAFGVSRAFPLARFVHANKAQDIEAYHLAGQSCVIIVDSVINEGDTIVSFVRRVRQICPIRIIVVAGVAQAASIEAAGPIAQSLDCLGRVTVVVLRVSQNKYKGSGGTDTGNRLFHTIYKEMGGRWVLQRSIS